MKFFVIESFFRALDAILSVKIRYAGSGRLIAMTCALGHKNECLFDGRYSALIVSANT